MDLIPWYNEKNESSPRVHWHDRKTRTRGTESKRRWRTRKTGRKSKMRRTKFAFSSPPLIFFSVLGIMLEFETMFYVSTLSLVLKVGYVEECTHRSESSWVRWQVHGARGVVESIWGGRFPLAFSPTNDKWRMHVQKRKECQQNHLRNADGRSRWMSAEWFDKSFVSVGNHVSHPIQCFCSCRPSSPMNFSTVFVERMTKEWTTVRWLVVGDMSPKECYGWGTFFLLYLCNKTTDTQCPWFQADFFCFYDRY